MNSSDRTGRIHSLETLGAADGPGLRLILFFQGCPLSCRFCHNPDTWSAADGTEFTTAELVNRALRYRPYYGENGGVTLSGGEPLLQADFTAELLRKLKEAGLSTALDTSGWLPPIDAPVLADILKYADRVILDIKSPDPEQFRWLTGHEIQPLRHFLDACSQAGSVLWIRQVIVPQWNDQPADIRQLAEFLSQWPQLRIEKVELLPYHTLGESKWQKLGRPYPLKGRPPLSQETLASLQKTADELIKTSA